MFLQLIVITIFLSLTACAPSPVKPHVAPIVIPPPPTPELSINDLPATSVKYRILALLLDEWRYFGEQEVILKEDMESIPRVGIWEDDDAAHSARISQYWHSAGKQGLSGYDCQQPWSAAFISWIMSTAGISENDFPYASAHWVYLYKFLSNEYLENALFVPRAVVEYSPKPGDLICANRDIHVSLYPDSLPLAGQIENTKLHCDIVIRKQGRILEAIGGNVRNSVSKSVMQLNAQGFLQPTYNRPWFMIVENKLD